MNMKKKKKKEEEYALPQNANIPRSQAALVNHYF